MYSLCVFFFFNDTATTEIYTLSLHDALPIYGGPPPPGDQPCRAGRSRGAFAFPLLPRVQAEHGPDAARLALPPARSEEHTSELQSRQYLVCRLLLEKKKKLIIDTPAHSNSPI